jgi:hypothetical protein
MRMNSRTVGERGKSLKTWRDINFGGRNSIVLLKGSHSSLPRISDNSSVKVKDLRR